MIPYHFMRAMVIFDLPVITKKSENLLRAFVSFCWMMVLKCSNTQSIRAYARIEIMLILILKELKRWPQKLDQSGC